MVLALGIGANTAMFSVVDAVVLRPLPYADPDGLVTIGIGQERGRPARGTASWLTYRDWREQIRSVAEMAAYHSDTVVLAGAGEPEQLVGVASTANLFALLGVPPALGRGFAAGEDQPGRNQVVVLSDRLWRRRFAADAGVLGRTVTLDGRPFTVIGVAPPNFRFPANAFDGDLWIPTPHGRLDARPPNASSRFCRWWAGWRPRSPWARRSSSCTTSSSAWSVSSGRANRSGRAGC